MDHLYTVQYVYAYSTCIYLVLCGLVELVGHVHGAASVDGEVARRP